MNYTIEFLPGALVDLRRLDKSKSKRILLRIQWLAENYDSISPIPLTGALKGIFKFRVGSYRVLYTLHKSDRLIIVHEVAHRKEIYRRK